MVEITLEEWEAVKKRLELLDALEAAGVDNWDGYDFALETLERDHND